jgi:sulfonate transport system permease protein
MASTLASAPLARRLRAPSPAGVVFPAALLAVWAVVAHFGWASPQVLPSPLQVASDLYQLAASGKLAGHVAATLQRVALGFAFGAGAATLAGGLTGYSPRWRAYLDPTLQALKAVPSLAWVPLFILWFGIFETSKVALIAAGVFFPVYLNLMTGVRNVDRKLVEVGLINNLGAFALVRRILAPAAAPSYFAGLRTGLAVGWMFVIAAELMGASRGLGFLMLDSEMTGRPSVIIGALILFALLGKASDAALVAVEQRLLAWTDDWAALQSRRAS